MTIRYFADTDTALIDLSEHAVSETIAVGENVYIDVDTEPLRFVRRPFSVSPAAMAGAPSCV